MDKKIKLGIKLFLGFIIWWGLASGFLMTIGGKEGIEVGARALANEFISMGWFAFPATLLFGVGWVLSWIGIVFILADQWGDIVINYFEKKGF